MPPLRAAVATAPPLSEKLKTILTELHRRFDELYGERLVKLILYGSRARGDARPWSDIDVLVVLKGPVNPSQERSRTEVVLGDVDEHDFIHLDSALMQNIRQEGIAV